jgi:transcriptional regulator with XRE-family HTH domain
MARRLTAGPDDLALGARIRIRRRALGLSQTDLARIVGVTFQQVQKYEHGANRIAASILVKIAAALDTSVAALVGEDGAPQTDPVIVARLATRGAPELLAAFATIRDEASRTALVELAIALAERPSRKPGLRLGRKGQS